MDELRKFLFNLYSSCGLFKKCLISIIALLQCNTACSFNLAIVAAFQTDLVFKYATVAEK